VIFTISVDLNSDLKRGMAFDDSGLIRGGTTLLF
jgi:hypothetical protein